METPVVLIVFNRPDVTQRVFGAIAQAKPKQLLVIADGPRSDRAGEAEKCSKVRQITEQVDWDCEVFRNYADTNLGCKQRVSTGLDWAFETVEEAIILEDDCLPHPSFFTFCEELLTKYRNDRRIMMVSGTNILGDWKAASQSYHYSYYGGIWGWASWRRAWQHYDVSMKEWENDEVKARIKDIVCDEEQYSSREHAYDRCLAGNCDTWDIQWNFSRLSQSGLSVVPSVNLISNIGFTPEATHTKRFREGVANRETQPISLPLSTSPCLIVDRQYDRKFYQKLLQKPSKHPIHKVRRLIRQRLLI